MGISGVVSSFEAIRADGAERRPRSVSLGPSCYVSSQGRSSTTLGECRDPQVVESRPTATATAAATATPTATLPSSALPVSHLLDFGVEARAERRELSARLASEVGVLESTALAALEAFGVDTTRARQWLQTSQHAQQVGLVGVGSRATATICLQSCFGRMLPLTIAGA